MAQEQLPQLFGVIPTSSPCITTPTSAPSPTSFLYILPRQTPFSHITVFLLPGINLPPNTAAAVYISLPPSQNQPQTQFKFLGGIGPGKESAVFKISGLSPPTGSGIGGSGSGEIDMDAPESDSSSMGVGGGGDITLGISLEPSDSVTAQIASLHQQSTTTSSNPSNSSTSALVPINHRGVTGSKMDTVVLAQRIIKNAFNFLASFSGNLDGGVEVVPLKAFEEWWRKFEGRVRADPGFLERDGD